MATLIQKRMVAALAWCGLAVAFKAQAAFLAPFMIGTLIGRRAPLWQWLVPGAVYAAAMLPAWLVGWPAMDLALIYVRQANEFNFAGNLASPWIWARTFFRPEAHHFYGVGYLAAALAAVAIAAASASAKSKQAMLWMATLSAMAIPFLLPKMHERYFFLADALALAIALANRDRQSIRIAVAVQVASATALFSYVTDWPVPAMAGAGIAALAMVTIAQSAIAEGVRLPKLPRLGRFGNSGPQPVLR